MNPAESVESGAIGPPGSGDPVFREPWEAQAFAMTLLLEARGAFSWAEWAQALGEQIRQAQRAGDPDLGESYYRHWLAALEQMVTAKGIASPAALLEARHAFRRAAERTPRGMPITVSAEDR